MTLKKYLFLLVIALLLVSSAVSAQQRSCGMEAHQALLMSDPDYAADRAKMIADFEIYNAENERSAPCSAANKILIPMAIHFQNATNTGRACLVALAKDQIRILNEDYGGYNADITNWTTNMGDFPGVSNGESCIEFCLPTMGHPASSGLTAGDDAVTINVYTGDSAPGWAGYINVFVRNIGALGYSPFPGIGNGDGVTIDNNAFGFAGGGCPGFAPSAPYNRGRTLTHELGHFLLLDHIWGNVGCGTGDGVSDTPNQTNSYGGCPANPTASCGSNDMHMNYMDYTNDACMYMFSAGQVTRMENFVNNNRQNLINKGLQVCSPTAACPPFLNETANISAGTQQIEAINYITSESDITGSADIQYNAGDYIELKQGFVAASPANFCAIIQACVPLKGEDEERNNLSGGSDNGSNNNIVSGHRTDSTIEVDIEHKGSEAIISIYDVEGEKVIADQKVSASDEGMVNFRAEINELDSDKIYYYILTSGETQKTGKFMILREED